MKHRVNSGILRIMFDRPLPEAARQAVIAGVKALAPELLDAQAQLTNVEGGAIFFELGKGGGAMSGLDLDSVTGSFASSAWRAAAEIDRAVQIPLVDIGLETTVTSRSAR